MRTTPSWHRLSEEMVPGRSAAPSSFKVGFLADALRLAFRTDSMEESGEQLPDTTCYRVHIHLEQQKVFPPLAPSLPTPSPISLTPFKPSVWPRPTFIAPSTLH